MIYLPVLVLFLYVNLNFEKDFSSTYMKTTLKSFIIPSIPLAVLLVASTILLWFISYFTDMVGLSRSQNYLISQQVHLLVLPDGILSQSAGVVCTLLNAYILAQLNNKFTFVRTRTFIPLFVFLLLMSTWTDAHLGLGANLLLTLIVLSLYFFLSAFRNNRATEESFMGSFLLSICAIFIHPLLLLIPVCWVGLIMLQSISWRILLASIFGTLTPWILYLAVKFFFSPTIDIQEFIISSFSLDIQFATIPLRTLIYISLLDLILLICLAGMYSISNSDSIYTRSKLNFLLLILISAQLFCLFFGNQLLSLLPLIAFIYAILVAHPFTLIQSKFYHILFSVFVSVNLLYIISQYIPF